MWSPSKSLVWRLCLFIIIGAGLVLCAVLLSSQASQSRLLIEQQHEQGELTTSSAVNHIDGILSSIQTLAKTTATSFASANPSAEEARRWLMELMGGNPTLSGMTVAYAPDASDKPFAILHAYRTNGQILLKESDGSHGEYMEDWFYLPQYMKRGGWVEPYYNQQGKTTAVTYGIPVFADNGALRAVIACDLSLEGIRDMLDALPLGDSGMAILLSSEGAYISHPVRSYEMRETIFSVAESLAGPNEKMFPCLEKLARTMLSGTDGMYVYKVTENDTPSYVFYRPVPQTGWVLYVTIPQSQILAPLRIQNRNNLIIGLCGGFLLLCAAIWVSISITTPLHQLAAAAGRLAIGDFDTPLPKTHRGDEIGRLTRSFAKMREDLHAYIEELTTTTAAKEKIASELSIAHQIQLGIVPKLFPPYPDRHDIDLFAALEPAREVGGDLYDFALLDEDHLYVAIGDVSGKGVPASLLMAVGKTLLKSTVQAVRDPARTLAMVNQELAEGNDACMFITAFCGILNLHSGHFTFANAGHNPPLVVGADGRCRFLRRKPGPALGVIEHAAYVNMDIRFDDGDLLMLYTDGVTEAMNPAGQMFGEDRMREVAVRFYTKDARCIVGSMVKAVHVHADGAEQSDDITLLAVRSMNHIQSTRICVPDRGADAAIDLPGRREALNDMVEWLERTAEQFSLDSALTMSLNLVLEEWFVNVVSYAYTDDGEHTVNFLFWKDDDRVCLRIIDDGQPFDPTLQAEPDTSVAIEQRNIGGLGIHFIRKTMTAMDYSRENDRNIVTLVKKLS